MPASTSSADASSGNSETDWISAITSLVAAIVGLITLLTVYLAALQILSRRQLYRLGLSRKYLGDWKKKVISPSLLQMQTQIFAPTISLSKLIEGDQWEPNFTLPIGFEDKPKNAISDFEKNNVVLAETSWINFLQTLGFVPENSDLYEMQAEPELVNGVVPMRWKGRDLVAICSMLGFNTMGADPKPEASMPLPTQWSGPLGWLQFRASFDGCIVEYRGRSRCKNQLPKDIHDFYIKHKPNPPSNAYKVKSRAWHSISCLYLSEGKALYLGGKGTTYKNRQDDKRRSPREICEQLLASDDDHSEEELRRMFWPKKEDRPGAITGLSQPEPIPELLRDILKDRHKDCKDSQKVEILNPSPGLSSSSTERELAVSRGLDLENCEEFSRKVIDLEDLKLSTHPHRLGCLCMGETLMGHIKKAVLLLKPDGFYFTPTNNLYKDLDQIFKPIRDQSDDGGYKCVFPKPTLDTWKNNAQNTTDRQLYHAMYLCDRFQSIKMATHVQFTIEDMKIISLASMSLDDIIGTHTDQSTKPTENDLKWAIIASPSLFSDLVKRFEKVTVEDVKNAKIRCKNGRLDCGSLFAQEKWYDVPLMGEGSADFTGEKLFAAFLHVFITYFWIENRSSSNVASYDAMVPQNVIMC